MYSCENLCGGYFCLFYVKYVFHHELVVICACHHCNHNSYKNKPKYCLTLVKFTMVTDGKLLMITTASVYDCICSYQRLYHRKCISESGP